MKGSAVKVFVMTDLEGVAGVVSFEQQSYRTGKYYEAAKKLLTAEINAGVDGMLEMGVEDVLVWDGHGAGGIVYEELHPAAKLMHGSATPPRQVRDEFVKNYDACMIIGQHAMAGTDRANQSHTQSSTIIDYYKLNGRPIGEIAQFALYHGAMDIPLIFLSGDDAACREVAELIAGITTATVKYGLGRNYAISLSTAEARRRIREGVIGAIRKQQAAPIPPLKWPGPYVLEQRFTGTEIADRAAARPGAERVDSQTVRHRGDDVRDVIYL